MLTATTSKRLAAGAGGDHANLNSPPLFDSKSSLIFRKPHEFEVHALVELKDGTFVSCSFDTIAKRWSTTNNILRVVNTYKGHKDSVECAVERYGNTLITGSRDGTLRLWNTSSGDVLDKISVESEVWSMLKTRNDLSLICGLKNGWIQVRRLSDLELVSSFEIHAGTAPQSWIKCICELKDGTFVSGAADNKLKRWDSKGGNVLQTFTGHSAAINKVISLKSNLIVSASGDKSIKIWSVSSGDCLHTLNSQHTDYVYGLVKLKNGHFASGSKDKTIVVWDHNGACIATYHTDCSIRAMTTLEDGSIATANNSLIEIRKP